MTTDELHSWIDAYFKTLVGFPPSQFQQETITKILNCQDVLLRAPTGSGKTETAIALSRHKLQTHSFRVHKGTINGFTGSATIQVLHSSDLLLANVANLLVHYAQFSGTGIKTRLGMGKTVIG